MDETQQRYQRILELDNDDFEYANYKVVYDTIIDGRLTYKRHSIIKACCIEHATDISNERKKTNEIFHITYINNI